jgi:hypothetical protein
MVIQCTLLDAASYDDDWKWVQRLCIDSCKAAAPTYRRRGQRRGRNLAMAIKGNVRFRVQNDPLLQNL